MGDLVDVFVGTASNSSWNKPIAFRGRLKGVRVAGGQERFWYDLLSGHNVADVLSEVVVLAQ